MTHQKIHRRVSKKGLSFVAGSVPIVISNQIRVQQQKAWAKAHPDKIHAASNAWKARNPDKVYAMKLAWQAAGRAWRARNPNKVRELKRAWKAKNRAQRIAVSRPL